MARKFNFFNFFEKKIDNAKIEALALAAEEVSLRELALHIAISYIANTLSKCEFRTYKDGKEVKEKLYYTLNVSPNVNENSSQFINNFVEKYFYDGESLVLPVGDQIFCADGFTPDTTNPLKEFTYSGITFGDKQLQRKYKASEVYHFKLDNHKITDIVSAFYSKYGELTSLAFETFKRTNGKKYKLILDEYRAGDKAFAHIYETVMKDSLASFVKNTNGLYIQYKGTELENVSVTPTSSNDIIALRKEIFETTAQAFKIPLPMMYGNITNINEIVRVYLSFCIDPLADMISEEFTRKYYSFEEWRKGNYIELDTSCVNYVDILDVADKVDKAISSGVCNIDELRKRCKYKPLETEFSTSHFMTKNYSLAENILKNIEGGGNS